MTIKSWFCKGKKLEASKDINLSKDITDHNGMIGKKSIRRKEKRISSKFYKLAK